MFRNNRRSFFFILLSLFVFSCYCSQWLYGRIFSIDNFGYLGYMIDPEAMHKAFPLMPLGELVPAYLPAHWIFQAFGSSSLPVTFVYKLLIASLCIFFVFGAARALFGLRCGMLAALLCFSCTYFLCSMGSEYPLGMAILYMSGVLFFLANAAVETVARRRIWLLTGAGAFWGLMLATAFLTVVYTPALLLFYFGARRAVRKKFIEATDPAVLIGATAVFALCAVLYQGYSGSYFFFASTLGKVTGYLQTSRITVASPDWFFEYGWLAMPIMLSGYGLAMIPLALKRRDFFSSAAPSTVAALIFSFSALAYLQFWRNQGTLSDPFYFNQLIPLITLALTATIFREFGSFLVVRPKIFLALTLVPFIFVARNFIKHDTGEMQVVEIICALLLASTALINRSFWRGTAASMGVPLLIALNMAAEDPRYDRVFFDFPLRLYERQEASIATVNPPLNMHEYKPEIHREVRDWHALISQKDPMRTLLLWFDVEERYGTFFRINSSMTHLWQGKLINEQFPLAVVPPKDFRGPSQIRPDAGMKVVVLTEKWDEKAPAAAASLSELGLSYSVEEKTRFTSGPVSYEVVFLDLKKL